jgi:hypothetical protein
MACSTRSGTSVFSTQGRKEMAEFDLERKNKPYDKPKNEFEVALNNHKAPTLDRYRLELFKSGFASKVRKENGKIILKLNEVTK